MLSTGDNSEHVLYENDDQDGFGNDDDIGASPTFAQDKPLLGDEDDIVVLSDPIDDSQSFPPRTILHGDKLVNTEEVKVPLRTEKDESSSKDETKEYNDTSSEAAWHLDASLPVGCTLYVKNLPTHFQSDKVRSYFDRHGEVIDCRIVINPVTKESRGFGFVTYSTLETADQAMAQMDQVEIEGRVLRVEKARRSKPHDPTPGEYKGPTGASIKYDNRGRLKPGYVPYWDLAPPTRYRHRNVGEFRRSDSSSRHLPIRNHRGGDYHVRRYSRDDLPPYRRYEDHSRSQNLIQPIRTRAGYDVGHHCRRPSSHCRRTRSRSRLRDGGGGGYEYGDHHGFEPPPVGPPPPRYSNEAPRYKRSPAEYYKDRPRHPPSSRANESSFGVHKTFPVHREAGSRHQYPLHENRLHSYAPSRRF